MPALPHKDEEVAVSASNVVLVAFDGVEAIDVAGPASVFSKAEQMHPGSYRLHIASPAGGTVLTQEPPNPALTASTMACARLSTSSFAKMLVM